MIALTLGAFRYKMVIAVRTDLEMGKGKIAVEVAHAAISALEEARRLHNDWVDAWLNEGQCKIAVKVGSDNDLVILNEEAASLGLPTALVRDRGLTQVPPDTATCLGIGPAPAEIIDKMTGHLKLL